MLALFNWDVQLFPSVPDIYWGEDEKENLHIKHELNSSPEKIFFFLAMVVFSVVYYTFG